MLFGMSSLPGKLIMGLEPFWDQTGAPLRWLDITAHPPVPILALPFIAYGAPRRWMRAAYRSGSSQAVELTLTDHLVVDGERVPPGDDGRVRVTATETATFLGRI